MATSLECERRADGAIQHEALAPVNAVAPGLTNTPMMRGPLDDPARLAQIPLGRIGEPDDVAAPVLFLASDDARWITGQTVDATGGYGI